MSELSELSKGLTEYGGIARRSVGLFGAGVMTLVLLFVMTQLINNEMSVLNEGKQIVLPSFVSEIRDRPPEVIKVKRPVLKKPPPIVKVNHEVKHPLQQLAVTPVSVKFEMAGIRLIGLPGGMALVPVVPEYPISAAQMGVCGDVLVQYDISEGGIPINVAILESSDVVFNRNALIAIERSRYKPHTNQDGYAIVARGIQKKISFTLDDGC